MVKIDIEIIKAVNAPVVILYISKRTMARQGGFPIIIFCNQAKSEYFQCLVCTEVCRSPVTCKSGHLFCHKCLSESLRRNSSCPACRERLTAPVPSAFAAAQVSALDVMCVHDKCKWIGTCGRLDGHLDTDCPHEPIKCSGESSCGELVPRGEMATHQQFVCLQSCPNSKAKGKRRDGPRDEQDLCNVRLSRHDLVDHLKDYCKLRIINCPHASCEVTTRYNQMPAHREVCPYAPVPCPRQCAAADLIRQSLEKHKNECPNEPVPCVHAPLGCSHVAPRSEIIGHEQDIAIHFSSLRSTVFAEQQEAYQQKIDEMKQVFEQKLQTLEKKITNLQIVEEKLKEQSALLKKLEEQNALLTRKVEEQSATFKTKVQEQTAALNTKLQEQTAALNTKLQEQTAALNTKVQEQTAVFDIKLQQQTAVFNTTLQARLQEQISSLQSTISGLLSADNLRYAYRGY